MNVRVCVFSSVSIREIRGQLAFATVMTIAVLAMLLALGAADSRRLVAALSLIHI